jgi:hypothetical protein
MVPATPFTIFTKSSNILFSDCIGSLLRQRRCGTADDFDVPPSTSASNREA